VVGSAAAKVAARVARGAATATAEATAAQAVAREVAKGVVVRAEDWAVETVEGAERTALAAAGWVVAMETEAVGMGRAGMEVEMVDPAVVATAAAGSAAGSAAQVAAPPRAE
jgi:hypothetical protein